ncbi:AAA family ATPase [Xylophilus rhododendri]|nr:AAA family ATPase [Xylophilus rhododendri]
MRLLRKPPQERYQTAAGIEADLRRCAAQLAAGQPLADFPLATQDMPERLQVPSQLYGREPEIEQLLQAWRAVATHGRCGVALIQGEAGIGKSSVVAELRARLAAQPLRFACGKFEQLRRDTPYAPIAQALRCLVAPVLGEAAPQLADWRRRMLEALEGHGQIVLKLVPELEHAIGAQPALPEVSAAEGRLRFHKTLQRFISVFCSAERPLLLFIDDLQWMDAASLELLSALVRSPELRHVLLVGAYRDGEVDAAHPLSQLLQAWRADSVPLQALALAPLAVPDLEALVARTVEGEHGAGGEGGRSAALARLVWQKTRGNPFFARQFIAALGEEGLIWFERASRRWVWHLPSIRAHDYSDNVADLMAGKLSRLPGGARRCLMLLACLGADATVATLLLVWDGAAESLHAGLAEAERAGLLARGAGSWRFLHDKIEEAAYEMIAPGERAAMHLHIARRLRDGLAADQREAMLFETVNQFGRAEALLDSCIERLGVAGLHLAAARRAMGETAYLAARSYLAGGQRLLPPHAWDTEYRLAFDLARLHAECDFLLGEPEAADARLAELAARAGSLLDRAAITALQVTVCLGLGQSARGIAVGVAFLDRLGTPWPQRPSRADVEREYGQLKARLGARPVESLLQLPAMAQAERRATLDVLAALLPPAFFSDENLVCLVLCRMVALSIEHGNAEASPLAYAYFGMMLGPYFHDYGNALRFGQLGLDLVEQGGLPRYRARVLMCFSYHVLPWARDMRGGQGLLRRAFEVARDTGDLTYAGFSSCCLVSSLLASGEPLDEVDRQAHERLEFVTAARFGLIVDIVTAQRRLIASLRGQTPVFGCLDDGHFDEAAFERHLGANRSLDIAACWYWIRKAQARFMAGEPAAAWQAMERAGALLWTSKGHLEYAEYHFFCGLIHAACCREADPGQREQHLQALDRHRALVDGWARHCPENFRSRAALLAAEAARLRNEELEAMRHYEAAIAAARASAFTHDEALAHELSARFYASRGLHAVAATLVRAARLAYARWGAFGKVRQLDRAYPGLADEFRAAPGEAIAARGGSLDAETVQRVSQALAATRGLDGLLRSLMTIALEHAGAERCLLVLPRGERLRIAAQASTVLGLVEVRLDGGEPDPAELPLPVLHYVLRTRTPVLIDDARQRFGTFGSDAYLLRSGARSVLCLPLLRQGEAAGLLYLENRLAGHVFDPGRVAMLGLLAGTGAIAMANATLAEKESLLQEVHHRVKNNLQLISSLLNLQASRIADPAVAELFADSRNRVRSMALVHENLYRAGNFARVPMAEHIGHLCAQLARAYGAHERGLVLTCRVEDVQLPLQRAVACGLIVNELVSNALKHGFPEGRGGEVLVALQATPDGRHALCVSDDGVGLPTLCHATQPQTLGLQLVEDLTAQLHGELGICRRRGTSFTVSFEAEPEPGRISA